MNFTGYQLGGGEIKFVPGNTYAEYKSDTEVLCVFRFLGMFKRRGRAYRNGYEYPKGRERWYLEREMIAHTRKVKTNRGISRTAAFGYRFRRLEPRDLPLYVYLPFKYPAWDKAMEAA